MSVLAYGNKQVVSASPGALAMEDIVPISQLASNPLRVEERTEIDEGEALTVSFPVWVDINPNGNTPMCAALEDALQITSAWAEVYSDSVAPVVINVSDGRASDDDDGRLTDLSDRLKEVATSKGSACFFNIQFYVHGPTHPLPFFPAGITNEFARRLYDISSDLPPYMLERARELGEEIAPGARGFAFNADGSSLITFLTIGSLGAPSA